VTAPNPRRAPTPTAPVTWLRLLLLVLALAATSVACSSSDPGAPTSEGAAAGAAEAERWSGDGDFYAPPDPLPSGKDGLLIRYEQVTETDRDDVDTYRLMYLSRTKGGAGVAATGLVFVPRRDAPEGGWPMVASLHGTSGMISTCAPSRDASVVPLARVEPNSVVVAPDYTGLGPTGQRHPYISGIPEGRSTIDLVRAARQLPGVSTRNEWVVYGLSQGGHAAVFTAEIAPTYAPELDLRGAVAIAPVGDLTDLEPYLDSPQRGLVPMFLYGLAEDNPDLVPDEFLSDAATERAKVIDTGCTDEILEAYRGDFQTADLFDVDPRDDPDVRIILEANSPGRVKTPVPILILHGIEDPIVPTSQSLGIFERQCALDMTVRLSQYQGSNHAMVILDADDEITAWIEDRFEGRAAPTNCAPADGTTGGTGTTAP
jgi:pimeloyl-ACP methyl ester carboxylesterase